MSIVTRLRREKRLLHQYVKEAKVCLGNYPRSFSWAQAIQYYPEWRQYLQANGHALESEVPWITIGAIRFLDGWLHSSMKVFEYGSGGSTLFFAKRADFVESVEHDADWARKVQRVLTEEGASAKVNLIEPAPVDDWSLRDPSVPSDYVSASSEFEEQSFEQYASAIDKHPDATFDVVLIDGRARPSCFVHALPKVCPGGLIMFDNTDRDRYQSTVHSIPSSFELLHDFPGPAPFLRGYTRTSIWQKKEG
jgi:predicted O-methyltransferase YrrM